MRNVMGRNTRIVAGLVIAYALATASIMPHLHGAGGALNPQPLPPLIHQRPLVVQVALNPQPEPPGRARGPRVLPPGPCHSVTEVA